MNARARFTAVLSVPFSGGWIDMEVGRYRTEDAAHKAVRRALRKRPHRVTLHGSRGTPYSGSIQRDDLIVATVDADEVIVPSVGDVGFW